jgi:CDP-glycerol glycerophosphotransferase (TagB/SpsB family)
MAGVMPGALVFFKLKRVLSACLRAICAILGLVVPTNRKLIGFISAPDVSDNSLAIFEKIIRSSRADEYHLVWLVKSVLNSERTLHRQFPNGCLENVSIMRMNSVRGMWSFLRCRYLFVSHFPHYFVHSGFHQTTINLWHGMPIKAIGKYDRQLPSVYMFTDYTIATSEYFADIMAEAFYLPRNRVLVTGLPRNEWLFQKEDQYLAVKEGREKLVIWLSTYRRSNVGVVREDCDADTPDSLSAETLTKLDGMLEGVGTMLVVKLHPMDIKNLESWHSYRNIRFYTDPRFRAEGLNLYKLLACSDALVTDFSSVAIDYLVLNKPIGLFAPDISSYSRGFVPGVLERVAQVCYQLRSVEDFGAFVTNPPLEHKSTPEQKVLYQMDLSNPSEAILRAVGLGDLISTE